MYEARITKHKENREKLVLHRIQLLEQIQQLRQQELNTSIEIAKIDAVLQELQELEALHTDKQIRDENNGQ